MRLQAFWCTNNGHCRADAHAMCVLSILPLGGMKQRLWPDHPMPCTSSGVAVVQSFIMAAAISIDNLQEPLRTVVAHSLQPTPALPVEKRIWTCQPCNPECNFGCACMLSAASTMDTLV